MPRKELPVPQPIINVNGTKNKMEMVKKAYILEIEHKGEKHLQQFYIIDLSFNWILLRYLWLSTYNLQINWKEESIKGEITLCTISNAWEWWKELQ